MNHLVVKGFKQGGKASITSAVQSIMRTVRLHSGTTVFIVAIVVYTYSNMPSARVCGCPSETPNFTEKNSSKHTPRGNEMLTKPASGAAGKARTLRGSLIHKLRHPAGQGLNTASLFLESIFLKQETSENKA